MFGSETQIHLATCCDDKLCVPVARSLPDPRIIIVSSYAERHSARSRMGHPALVSGHVSCTNPLLCLHRQSPKSQLASQPERFARKDLLVA